MGRLREQVPLSAWIAVGIAAVILIISFTVPAFAGKTAYQSVSAKKTAKKALSVARSANARSKQALSTAKRNGSGKTGRRGATGKTGKTGKTGPAGPTASSSASSATNAVLDAQTQVLSATIVTKLRSRILASASAQLSADGGNDDQASCWLSIGDGTAASDISQRLVTGIPATTPTARQTISLDGATVQNAGSYTIKLFCAVSAGSVSFDQGNLNLVAAAG